MNQGKRCKSENAGIQCNLEDGHDGVHENKLSGVHVTWPNIAKPDAINPSHYKTSSAEVIQITRDLSFNRGNAVKYLARAGKKNKAEELQDLKKALWYVIDEIYACGGDVDEHDIAPHAGQSRPI
jgi:Protein of unknwon function (DUF3310)